MTKRKSTGKKLRFEVFKRDKFTCQYCGRKAPDVVLVCDHVAPVASGGPTNLLNLITSCVDCNAGKGARALGDDTAVAKQRAELERLAERREQIDMMVEWSRGLEKAANYELDAFSARWSELLEKQFYLNESGLGNARKWLRTFGLQELLAAADVAAAQYLKRDNAHAFTAESVNLAWSKIPGIARLSKMPPGEKDLYYARGILRNRLKYINEREAMTLLRDAQDVGIDGAHMKEIAKRARNWTHWHDLMTELIEGEMG